MMSVTRGYRQNALDERRAAARAKLELVASRHLEIARQWDALADELHRLILRQHPRYTF